MLRIKEAKTVISTTLYLGLRMYHIELSDTGTEIKTEDLAMSAATYGYVSIDGDRNLKQMIDIADLCKQIQKNNPETKIFLTTFGTARPSGINIVKNMEHIVRIKPTSEQEVLEASIDEKVWKWLEKAGAKFIFTVFDKNDIDNINLVCAALVMNKHQFFFRINSPNFKELAVYTISLGFNICMEMDDVNLEDTDGIESY